MKLKLTASVVNVHNHICSELRNRGRKPVTIQRVLLMLEGLRMDKSENFTYYDSVFFLVYFSELAKQFSKLHEVYTPTSERVADMAEAAYTRTLMKLNQIAFTQTNLF